MAAKKSHNGELVQVNSRSEWRDWLKKNHSSDKGIWLVTFKKHVPEKYVSYDEIVEEALCFGWVDSLPRRLDDDRKMLWLAPRKQGSGWSKLNKGRVVRLIREKKMTAAGLKKIDAAKKDGSWKALDAAEKMTVPPDLALEFKKYAHAGKNFHAFPNSAKKGILEWITEAKKPETRSKRVKETARLAHQNIRANEWRKPG